LGQLCWVISFLVGWISASDQNMMMDLFKSSGTDGSKEELTNITWAHAVNSKERLTDALKGPAQMLEADIVMGTTKRKSDSEHEVPIMAHPPNTTSDLSFNKFLSAVIKHNIEERSKKGIKLDFKQLDCVEPVLQELRDKKKSINFPVWLNADVLPGPVNATTSPLDGKRFITLMKELLPKATLSLGWTTRYWSDDENQESTRGQKARKIISGQYTKDHVDEMVKLWNDSGVDSSTVVTFPVRCAIASQSVDALVDLLDRVGTKSTLTLWSPVNDPLNVTKINNLIETVGKDRVYCDLPTGYCTPEIEPTTESPDTTTTQKADTTTPNSNGTDNGKNEGSAPTGTHTGLTFFSLIALCFAYFL